MKTKQPIRARDVMQTELISLSPRMTLSEARDILVRNRISGAPVVNEQGLLVGVLSQSDLVRETYACSIDELFPSGEFLVQGLGCDIKGTASSTLTNYSDKKSVGDVMNTEISKAAPSENVSELARMMRQRRIHRVLIVDKDQLVGIVSTFDLMRLIEEL